MVYLSNETDGAELVVSWDDFTIYHGKTNVVSTQDYYPFGLTFNESVRVASVANRFKYNSFEYIDDLNLNLYDYQARYYDPAIGRFMMVDPLTEVARRWSPYTYTYNNPLRFIDPDGMLAEDVIKKNGDCCGGGTMGVQSDNAMLNAMTGTATSSQISELNSNTKQAFSDAQQQQLNDLSDLSKQLSPDGVYAKGSMSMVLDNSVAIGVSNENVTVGNETTLVENSVTLDSNDGVTTTVDAGNNKAFVRATSSGVTVEAGMETNTSLSGVENTSYVKSGVRAEAAGASVDATIKNTNNQVNVSASGTASQRVGAIKVKARVEVGVYWNKENK